MSEKTQNEKEQKIATDAAEEMEQHVVDDQPEAEEQQEQQSAGESFFRSVTNKVRGKVKRGMNEAIFASLLMAGSIASRATTAKERMKLELKQKALVVGARSTRTFIRNNLDSKQFDATTITDLLETCDAIVETFSSKNSTK